MKKSIIISFILLSLCNVHAQFLDKLKKTAENSVKKTVERRVETETSKKTDKTIDKVLDKNKNSKSSSSDSSSGSSSSGDKSSFGSVSKYDFVTGDQVIAFEDFSQDAVGDFPAKWNTDTSGEIMTLNGKDGKWLTFTRSGAFTPDFINKLPENFTLEFDLVASPDYDYYDGMLGIALAKLKSKNDFASWKLYGDSKRKGQSGVMLWLHPQESGVKVFGRSDIEIWENGSKTSSNKLEHISGFSKSKNSARVAIWRQNQRLRVYVNEEKIWDLPKAFSDKMVLNTLVFSRYDAKENHNFFISNVKLAIGQPDTRHKLLDEGKFSTTGIYFSTGSADIKPESHGVIKEIADVLKENESVKIKIIGHTDNSGNSDTNQSLSEKRAESVKKYFVKNFGIDKDRITTSGKGQSEPVADNSSPDGKAKNRRVEFIKQ